MMWGCLSKQHLKKLASPRRQILAIVFWVSREEHSFLCAQSRGFQSHLRRVVTFFRPFYVCHSSILKLLRFVFLRIHFLHSDRTDTGSTKLFRLSDTPEPPHPHDQATGAFFVRTQWCHAATVVTLCVQQQ